MEFLIFVDEIKMGVSEALGNACQVEIKQVRKNNGIVLTALYITDLEEQVRPVIYLEPLYKQYLGKQGRKEAFQESVQAVVRLYWKNKRPLISEEITEGLTDIEQIKSKIMYKLINTQENIELLKEIPHISYLDLSFVFYLYMGEDSDGCYTAQIGNDHLKIWNITSGTLFSLAKVNTPVMFPAKLCSVEEMIFGCELSAEDKEIALFVLTNKQGINGSAAMFYENEIKKFADRVESDVIILPSSIHEVLLLPSEEELNNSYLKEMVWTINREQVKKEERLSDHVYCYKREDGEFQIMA